VKTLSETLMRFEEERAAQDTRHAADIEAAITTSQDEVKKLEGELSAAKGAIDSKIQQSSEKLANTSETVAVIEGDLKAIQKANSIAKASQAIAYQNFNRAFSPAHYEVLKSKWFKSLNIHEPPKSIAYMANRICTLEQQLKGRLATSIENAILRLLVALSIHRKTLSVLEIGTLFGVGVAMIHDRASQSFEKVHLTVLDPLEGYYGNDKPDTITSESINKDVLMQNIRAANIPEKDFHLIQGFSSEDEIIEEAGKRAYDLLIIDGDHSYAGVKTDFVNYAPFVKRAGYIIIDDYGVPEWPEITEYVDKELLSRDDITLVGASWRSAVFKVVKKVKP